MQIINQIRSGHFETRRIQSTGSSRKYNPSRRWGIDSGMFRVQKDIQRHCLIDQGSLLRNAMTDKNKFETKSLKLKRIQSQVCHLKFSIHLLCFRKDQRSTIAPEAERVRHHMLQGHLPVNRFRF